MEREKFDTELEPWDWRYAAAIVGLNKYLQYHGDEGEDYEVDEETLRFSKAEITEERYLEFVEDYYGEELLHIRVENLLKQPEFSNEIIKLINDLLKGNSVMKKVFKGQTFTGDNVEMIGGLLSENREMLIRETYRNKANMYANFANTGQLLEEGKSCCRLLGYYVDGGRKSKSISYQFDLNSFVCEDSIYFDFIPFAFSGEREMFFINDNFNVRRLISSNRTFERLIRERDSQGKERGRDARKVLFRSIQETADFIDYDVEVIGKNRELDFFETIYIRRESIAILRKLGVYEPFCFSKKINDNYYLNVQKKVAGCILNLLRTDELIELFLKENAQYLVSLLITINTLMSEGGNDMTKSMQGAYACGKTVVAKLPENKRESYRQKLISCIIFKDYDRCCQILLQLSNYSGVAFGFVYDLFEDFENNKDIAYTFINALGPNREAKQKED